MVNTDGTVYIEHEVRNVVEDVITSDTLYLWISGIGDIVLSTTTQDQALMPGSIIPDGNGGVLATWTISPSHSVLPFPYQAADVTGLTVGTPYNLPFSPQYVAPFVTPTLVLGENGTVFASGSTTIPNNGGFLPVDQIASFNISSGATNWTYQAAQGIHLSVIEATFGNGLAAKSTDTNGVDTVLLFNSSGGQNQVTRKPAGSVRTLTTQSPTALSGFSNIDYASNGLWLGSANGTGVGVLGTLIQPAMSSYAHVFGALKLSSGLPIIDTFEPFDAGPTQLAINLPSRYQQVTNTKGVSIWELTTKVNRVLDEAKWKKFQNRPATVAAQAYIGHSIIPDTMTKYNYPNRAFGLCFSDWAVERAAVPGDPEYTNTLFAGYSVDPPCPILVDYPASPPTSQATIMFISACATDANMQAWLGISNSTTGRWLVAPNDVADILLTMGEYEWLHILRYLTSGQNLKDAVNNANTDVQNAAPWKDNTGKVYPPEAWQVIGNNGDGGAGMHF